MLIELAAGSPQPWVVPSSKLSTCPSVIPRAVAGRIDAAADRIMAQKILAADLLNRECRVFIFFVLLTIVRMGWMSRLNMAFETCAIRKLTKLNGLNLK